MLKLSERGDKREAASAKYVINVVHKSMKDEMRPAVRLSETEDRRGRK